MLVLSPYNGNKLVINGAVETIPSGGVSLSATTGTTLYYIYASMSAGSMVLSASATVPVTSTTTGFPVMTGDATKSLVGMAYSDTGAWVDSVTKRYVRSWYNRQASPLLNNFTNGGSGGRGVSSTSYGEVNSEIRINFILWSGESFDASFVGVVSALGGAGSASTSLAFDGTTAEDTFSKATITAAGSDVHPVAVRVLKSGLSEGLHYCTVLGAMSANTSLYTGNNTAGLRSTLTGMVVEK
jgi:hypothetical protein